MYVSLAWHYLNPLEARILSATRIRTKTLDALEACCRKLIGNTRACPLRAAVVVSRSAYE